MTGQITVIGIGEDGIDGLSQSARTALNASAIVYGGPRHLEMLADESPRDLIVWSKDLGADLERMAALAADQSVTVLASGDPMLHGIGVRIVERFGIDNVHIIPSSSAFSLEYWSRPSSATPLARFVFLACMLWDLALAFFPLSESQASTV